MSKKIVISKIELCEDELSLTLVARGIQIFNQGTFSCRVDGMVLMPGDTATYETNICASDEMLELSTSLIFLEHHESANPRLSEGKKVLIRLYKSQ